MSTTYFTSDSHYNHKNIVLGVTNWPEDIRDRACRPFETLEAMNETLIERINQDVKKDDTLYHLGDWSFGDFENVKIFRDRINCKTVHLILGNHDHHIACNRGNITPIFSSVSYYREATINGQFIIMSHYPFKVWNRGHHGSWMLHGHSHGQLPADTSWLDGHVPNPTHRKTMDVGVDTNNLCVYSFDEIQEIMKDRGFSEHH